MLKPQISVKNCQNTPVFYRLISVLCWYSYNKTSVFHCHVLITLAALALQLARIGQEFFRHCSAPMAFDPVKGRYLKVDSVTNSCPGGWWDTVGLNLVSRCFKILTFHVIHFDLPFFPAIPRCSFRTMKIAVRKSAGLHWLHLLFAAVGGMSTVTCLTTRSSTRWSSTLARRWWDKPMRRGCGHWTLVGWGATTGGRHPLNEVIICNYQLGRMIRMVAKFGWCKVAKVGHASWSVAWGDFHHPFSLRPGPIWDESTTWQFSAPSHQ